MNACVVCKELTKKYKCPKCRKAYCSLDCYGQHKETPECLSQLFNANERSDLKESTDIEEPTVHEPFKTEDTVAQDKLQQLVHSKELRNLLYNSHLRNLLYQIDTAPNAWKAIRAAMHEPLFLEFADECLRIIEPNTNEEIL